MYAFFPISNQNNYRMQTILRITLFRTLFKNDLSNLQGKTQDDISEVFQSKFPEDVVQSSKTMSALLVLSKRIENANTKYPHSTFFIISSIFKRYAHVVTFACDCVSKFLEDPPSITEMTYVG